MKAFGKPWAHEEMEIIPTPVGQRCIHCDEPIAADDQGVVMPYFPPVNGVDEVAQHRECFLRKIFGSVGHQRKTCSCYGGTEEDPPGLSVREAAKAAMNEMFQQARKNLS